MAETGHRERIEARIKQFEEGKKRADFRYTVGKVGEVDLKMVHALVNDNRTKEYRCVYAIESGDYVVSIRPR